MPHRTVATASATDSDREIRLALVLVLRKKVVQQIAEAPQSLCHFGLGVQVLDDAAVAAGQRAPSVDKKRVRQMPHIEEQFHIPRRAALMTKTQELHAQRRSLTARTETFQQ